MNFLENIRSRVQYARYFIQYTYKETTTEESKTATKLLVKVQYIGLYLDTIISSYNIV